MSTIFGRMTPDAQALYNRGKDAMTFMPNISSGHRTAAENSAAKGKPTSNHLTGNAFDIPTRNLTPSQQQEVLDYYRSQPGVYVNDERNRPGYGPHIHVSYRGKEGESAAKGDKDDGSGKGKRKDGKEKTEEEKKKDDEERAKSKKPVDPKDHKDIKGEPSNYQEVQTKSIVGILPTHEPWPGHPNSKVGPRQAYNGQQSQSGNNGSGAGGANGANGGAAPDGVSRSGEPNSNLDKSTDAEKAKAIQRTADRLGINATDLATIISYESAGSMSPSKRGGMNKDGSGKGSFLGLIQFSPPNQAKYGVHAGQTFDQQMNAVENYLRDRGVKPGMGILDVYSSINAGRPGKHPNDPIYNKSDVNGTQRQHIAKMLNSPHRKRAQRIMGSGNDGAPERADNGRNQKADGQKPQPDGGGTPQGTPQSNDAPTAKMPAAGMPGAQTSGISTGPNTGKASVKIVLAGDKV